MKNANPNTARATPLLLPLVISLSLAQSAAVQAQTSSRLDNLLVTATRTAQTLDDTLANATIITREEIESAGPVTLTDLLQRKAGLEIRTTGGAGQQSSVLMRGGNSGHTLVLVDGLRVGSSTSGATAFENIPLDVIERIEVVKGPHSSLYGSDGIGGVIQIFTRGYNKSRFTGSAGFGTNSTAAFNAGFSVIEGKVALTFDAGYQSTKPKSATKPTIDFPGCSEFNFCTHNPDRDPYKNVHALFKLTQTLWQGETITLSAWQSRGKTEFDDGPTSAQPPYNKQTLSGYQLSTENNFSPAWKSRVVFGQTTDDSAIRSSFVGNFKTQQNQASWLNELKTATGHMSAGVEWRSEKLATTSTYTAKSRETTSVFAGYLEKIGATQVELSVRRDEEDQFGARNTGSASYGHMITPGLSAYARVGHAFRAPSFNDLYIPDYGNPNLKPEQSDQAEVGLRFRGGAAQRHRVDVTYFENRIKDLIVFVSDPVTFEGKPENVDRARIRGWELQAETSFVGMAVKAALTVQQPLTLPRPPALGLPTEPPKQLRSRAKRFGSISLTKDFGKWALTTDVVASGARFDSSNERPSSRMAGYALLNAGVRYRIDKTWSVEFTGQNLTDKKYELAQGYNTPSRSVFVNVRAIAF